MAEIKAEIERVDSFENVKAFLRYVQGECGDPRGIPSTIVDDLRELEGRAQRVKAMTGLMTPVELSPYMLSLLKSARSEDASPVDVKGAVRAASA